MEHCEPSRPMQEVSVECPQAQLQVPPDHRSCCQSCGQTFSPDDLVVFCPGCDDVVYCSLECGERDRPRHESECPTVALNGFKDKLEGLITSAGCEGRLREWLSKARCLVQEQKQAPRGVTLEQLDDLLEHFRLALHCFSDPSMYSLCFSLLGLRIAWTRIKRGPVSQEGFMRIANALLFSVPPDSALWYLPDASFVCSKYGELLCKLGRANEAVELGRRVAPALLASLKAWSGERAQALHVRTESVCFVMKCFAQWLKNSLRSAIETSGADSLATRNAVMREAAAVMQQAIDLAEAGSVLTQQLGDMYIRLTSYHLSRHAYDEALKAARRGSKISFRSQQELVTQTAMCLVELGRDAQAEPLIKDNLLMIRRKPHMLSDCGKAFTFYYNGVILCRRGECDRAVTSLEKSALIFTELEQRARDELGDAEATSLDTIMMEMGQQMMEALEQVGETKRLRGMEAVMKGRDPIRPQHVMRVARSKLSSGQDEEAMQVLRDYAEQLSRKEGLVYKLRGRWKEGDAWKPLEMLRDLLQEGSPERAQVEETIARTAREDEELRRQALEELQREMREEGERKKQARQQGAPTEQQAGAGTKAKASKASRKKKKKRERKKQQRQDMQGSGEQEETAVGVALESLSLKDEEGQAVSKASAAVPAEEENGEEDDECPMCLQPFGEDEEEREEVEEVLGCGHRFHDTCIDRWLCKCREKGLPATCPMCRSELVRSVGRKH